MRLALAVGALASCQPTATTVEGPFCPPDPIPAGEISVSEVVCGTQRFTSTGEGRTSDLSLANSRFRAIVRHPQAALTLAGVGGMTLVDAAPWGQPDALHEAALLIDGGWLVIDAIATEDDGFRVEGNLVALPDRPLPAEGTRHSVRLRIAPDDPWIRFEGADGLWIHPRIEMELVDGWLMGGGTVLGHDGTVEADLGGAIRVQGATGLLVAHRDEAWAHRPGPTQTVSGTTTPSAVVRLYEGQRWVGTIGVDSEGSFEATVPATVDSLRATSSGRAPSPPTPVADGVVLTLGGTGDLDLRPAWGDTLPRPFTVSWDDGGLRSGETVLRAAGGPVSMGAGPIDVVVSAGPGYATRSLHVDLPPDGREVISVSLATAVDTRRWILADLGRSSTRSRHVRALATDLSREAVGAGVRHAVFTAEDDVATAAAYVDDEPWITWDHGATLQHPAGWSITAWPWSSSVRKSGHGAIDIAELDPTQALLAAWGGAGPDRTVMVDLPWLQAVDRPPWQVDPIPDFVRLPAPGAAPFAAWAPWFAWLDAQRALLPAGPAVWLDVGDAAAWGRAELGRALERGRLVAGTGPMIGLDVSGHGPGEAALEQGLVEVTVAVPHGDVDRVSLVTSGDVLHTWTVAPPFEATLEVTPTTWITAVAWHSVGDTWAVAAPIWTQPPVGADTAVPEDPP